MVRFIKKISYNHRCFIYKKHICFHLRTFSIRELARKNSTGEEKKESRQFDRSTKQIPVHIKHKLLSTSLLNLSANHLNNIMLPLLVIGLLCWWVFLTVDSHWHCYISDLQTLFDNYAYKFSRVVKSNTVLIYYNNKINQHMTRTHSCL